MSKQMTDQVGSQALNSSLETLDAWSQQGEGKSALAIGPFSVIDFGTTTVTAQIQAHQVLDTHTSPQASTTPSSLGIGTSVPDYLQWSDLFDLEFETWLGTQTDPFQPNNNHTVDESFSQQLFSSSNNEANTHISEQPALITHTFNDEELKSEASFLIKHFSSVVIETISALPLKTKSPFNILNVASAVQTLADLTYLDRSVKHATAANLFAVLACSAYHLAHSPILDTTNTAYWERLAVRAGIQAKEQLQKSLQTELTSDSKAKYKDQLMALLCTLTYSIFAGHQIDARCYMIDAERLLRLRGLAKRHISRRSRLLHHVYTWHRIIGESTYVFHDQKTSLPTVMPPITSAVKSQVPNTGHNARLDDFLRIEQSDDHEADYEDPKDVIVSLHDIHLEDPRFYADTMYLQIYGLPETWLSLLSQTTRLANVTEMQKSGPEVDNNTQKTFEKRAAKLEDMICSFAARGFPIAEQTNLSLARTQYMLQALSSALVIYFYRRIRNVNSLILQSHVDEVFEALRGYDASLDPQSSSGPGTGWPAFIAGCESSAGQRRNFALSWMKSAFSRTGMQGYKSAQAVMVAVWERRDQPSASPRSTRNSHKSNRLQSSATWMEIAQEKKEWVLLC